MELEEKLSVALGKAYRNNMSGSMMIYFIGKWLSNELKKELEEADFFNILMDSWTEKQLVFLKRKQYSLLHSTRVLQEQIKYLQNPHEKINQCLTDINWCLTDIFKI